MRSDDQPTILRKGAAAWNEWRNENRGKQIDLGGANLMGADLGTANLNGADLRKADLERAAAALLIGAERG